ncbi:hypothetical protein [Pseudomonas sp. C2B4]|uniref:hypothetical protein n=1 Tax=Pseudomonas sp. C2B4 TaxID=2735270 RepID=UPI001586A861|nr:hypothetical protein [Pseudomonas sp. C2B4]NUU34746.1 hypothetical protein [Pseudomonas sp. C2B4]
MSDDVKKTWQQFVSEYQAPSEAAWINDFAIRCFRDTGDGDYIAARLALRAGLATQAIWSGLQAVEKYLKCMLLLRRVSSKGVGHNIAEGLRRVNDRLGYDIVLPDDERAVFNHLAESGGDRYLVVSLHLFDHELAGLDALVWRLRQYCVVLDIEHYNDKPSEEVLSRNLNKIKARLGGEPAGGHLEIGALEKILADQHHRAHKGLVWRNAMFGGGKPFSASDNFNFVATNSPLYLNPQIARAVSKLVQLPNGALEAFEHLAIDQGKV